MKKMYKPIKGKSITKGSFSVTGNGDGSLAFSIENDDDYIFTAEQANDLHEILSDIMDWDNDNVH